MMHIISVQAQAMIQDLGRFGLRHFGIGQCGAMDRLALRAGNLLLGNDENTPVIEIPLGGLTVYFEQDTTFCLTGALYEAYLDEIPVYSYWRYPVKSGQILRLVRAKVGMYVYLCVQGGFSVPLELGSASTDVRTRIGGLEGRTLQVGDCLAVNYSGNILSHIGIAPIPFTNEIYALPSSEYQAFSRQAQYDFWYSSWYLQSNSDRMGYRLKGAELKLIQPLEMLSHGIQFGSVQVPPSGQPIVLMADAQTTGGYPKIASVIEAYLGRFAQIRFGGKLRFKQVNFEQAEKLRLKNEIYLNQVRWIFDETKH